MLRKSEEIRRNRERSMLRKSEEIRRKWERSKEPEIGRETKKGRDVKRKRERETKNDPWGSRVVLEIKKREY